MNEGLELKVGSIVRLFAPPSDDVYHKYSNRLMEVVDIEGPTGYPAFHGRLLGEPEACVFFTRGTCEIDLVCS